MKNLLTRTFTGLVYVIVIVGGILGNSYTFLALFSVVTVVCLWEFYRLIQTQKQAKIHLWYHCLGGGWMFVSMYLYASGIASQAIFLTCLAYAVTVFILELYEKQQDPVTHCASIFLGHCYITFPLSMMNVLVFSADNTGAMQYNPVWVLALFVFIWIYDTGAYLIGSRIGKHRLFERISPKKSWEGFFGGLFFTVIASWGFARFQPEIPYYHWVGLALVVAIFATWGDLVESLIKRTVGVKDSGKILPGHGGFLDRFDSLLLAVYAMLFYVKVFIQN
ncbi:MAG: phosphatidate cytidylyltransferase [Dysgonamonadaceae bacterium]|jgi:phosphatidate cytidylyltransferase|nr:phosphatidate cytidylyltransferase [Dysgonamonadaceae bacterium]